MREKLYADIKDIQRSMNAIPKIISIDEIKMSLNSLLDRAKRYIESEGTYFKLN